jgi:Protein of unknown function (DUF1275)
MATLTNGEVSPASRQSVSGDGTVSAVDKSNSAAPPKTSLFKRVSNHLGVQIHPHDREFPMLLCSFVSGMQDSNTVDAWGVFANMQTGRSNCYSYN